MMCSASGGGKRPFAVGVLALDPRHGENRTTQRLNLALDAYKYGYFLLDTVETNPAGTGYLAAELLVSRSDAAAIVIRGPVDADWVHSVADRHGLVIRRAHRR